MRFLVCIDTFENTYKIYINIVNINIALSDISTESS